MNRQEITTIIEAAAKKQTWIIRELENFLTVWGKIEVPEDYNGARRLELYVYEDDERDCRRVSLCLGSPKILDEYHRNRDISSDSWIEIAEDFKITIPIAKEIIEILSEKLIPFFREIQKQIDADSKTGQKIARIAAALS
jgi:hypothetical protein